MAEGDQQEFLCIGGILDGKWVAATRCGSFQSFDPADPEAEAETYELVTLAPGVAIFKVAHLNVENALTRLTMGYDPNLFP